VLQIPDLLLQIIPDMLQVKVLVLQKSQRGLPVMVEMLQISQPMLRMNLDLQHVLSNLQQIKTLLLQMDGNSQQNLRSALPAIVQALPTKEAGSLGILDLLQIDPVLQQIEDSRPAPIARGGRPRAAGRVVQ
jgi:hypothetical protein